MLTVLPTCKFAGRLPTDTHIPQGHASPTNPADDRPLARALPCHPDDLPALGRRLRPHISQGPVSPGVACRHSLAGSTQTFVPKSLLHV